MPALDIRPLDLDDRSALAAAYAVECEATRQTRSGWQPLGESPRIAAWQATQAWTHRLVGAFEAGTLIGFASCATSADDSGAAWVNVAVSPRHQRRGVGAQLVRAVEGSEPGRVERFVASAYRPTSGEIDALARQFAAPLGYAPATGETVVELDLDHADLPGLATAAGYTVSTYVDGVPAAVRREVGVLKGLVDAEAPHGELDWQPTPVSPQEYQDEIDLWQRQGRTAIESLAVDDRGVVAGWTCLVVAADEARPAQVEGTLVRAEHRGRGLGRAVKVACLRAAREHGRATRVRTSSDDENEWMRAINEALGFVPVEREIVFQRRRSR